MVPATASILRARVLETSLHPPGHGRWPPGFHSRIAVLRPKNPELARPREVTSFGERHGEPDPRRARERYSTFRRYRAGSLSRERVSGRRY